MDFISMLMVKAHYQEGQKMKIYLWDFHPLFPLGKTAGAEKLNVEDGKYISQFVDSIRLRISFILTLLRLRFKDQKSVSIRMKLLIPIQKWPFSMSTPCLYRSNLFIHTPPIYLTQNL